MGNKQQAPPLEPGYRAKSHYDDQYKADLSTLKKYSKSERNLTEKLLEQYYDDGEIPHEIETISSEAAAANIRILRTAPRHKYTACDCTEFNIKNIHATNLSPQQMVHIAAYHKPVYNALKMSKQRSERYLRLDLEENHQKKNRNNVQLLKKSMSVIHDNKEKIANTILYADIKPRCRRISGNCASEMACVQFDALCKAYKNINKTQQKDTKNMGKYRHCVQYHADEYPPICTSDECNCDPKSTQLCDIIHGHWFHRYPLNKLQDECKEIERRRKTTLSPRYTPLCRTISYGTSGSFSTSNETEGCLRYPSMLDIKPVPLFNMKSLQNALEAEPISEHYNELQFGAPFSIHKADAKFKNAKEEMLRNEFRALSKQEWNELLRKCVFYVKSKEAKINRLTIKEIVALKLYTDYDSLQHEYRKCFRSDETKRQRQFFWWNSMLEIACAKSGDIVTKKIFHGVSAELTLATFSGTYYGPVSTTTLFAVAKSFAGVHGKIIELYPSFGRRGIKVSFLSNFPEEDEILWMNTSFQIHDIYEASASAPRNTIIGGLNATNDTQADQFERAVMKAIQSINIESKVISLNVNNKYWVHSMDSESKEDDISGFIELSSRSQLAVLYLLYLQYRKKEWDDFVEKTSEFVKNALEKFRTEFVLLAENVKAVKMERLSKPLQIFFYTVQKEYIFPIKWYDHKQSHKQHTKYCHDGFKKNQAFHIDTIVRLFPKAEQISLNASNWDFSLNNFINFLDKFDMDYADIKLQDIFIKFIVKKPHKTQAEIVMDNNQARDCMKAAMQNKNINASQQLAKLRKLGWKFVNNSHLHRASCEPAPELPFVMAFCKARENTRFFYRSYSMQLTSQQIQEINTLKDEIPGTPSNTFATLNLTESKTEQEVKEEVDEGQQRYVVLQHNPANCVLSKHIFDILTYKDKLMLFLQHSKRGYDDDEDRQYKYWLALCDKVLTLVLDPMADGLKDVFMEHAKHQPHRAIISFKTIFEIFHNVQEVFLRDTMLNLRICYKFIHVIKEYRKKEIILKLERVFFKKPQHETRPPERHILRFNLVLKPYSWKLNIFENCLQKC